MKDKSQIRCNKKDCEYITPYNTCGKYSIDMKDRMCMSYLKKYPGVNRADLRYADLRWEV